MPNWKTLRRPAHLTTRRQKMKRASAPIELNHILWITLILTLVVLFVFA